MKTVSGRIMLWVCRRYFCRRLSVDTMVSMQYLLFYFINPSELLAQHLFVQNEGCD